MLSVREDAGDLPTIPIVHAEYYNDELGQSGKARFIFHEVIGKGGFSTVRRAICKNTGETYAFKIIDKSIVQNNFARVILEIETLMSVKHPYICKLYSVFYTGTKIYMAMDYCCMDLFEYLANLPTRMPEEEARRLFIQLLDTIIYLHSVGIAHRDIKPENILLTEYMDIRLTDFGLSSTIQEIKDGRTYQKLLFTHCGSPAYCAPEIVLGCPYNGAKVDTWALGVNLYVLLSSELPFVDANPQKVKCRIINSNFRPQYHFSSGSLTLIKRILQVNPQNRPTCQEIWEDPWIQGGIRRGHNLKPLNRTNSKKTLPIPVHLVQKPTTCSNIVQIDRPLERSIICRLMNSTGKKLLKLRNFILCCS